MSQSSIALLGGKSPDYTLQVTVDPLRAFAAARARSASTAPDHRRSAS